MASDVAFVEFLVDQMSDAGRIASRKMFGEYAIYPDSKPKKPKSRRTTPRIPNIIDRLVSQAEALKTIRPTE